MTETYLVIHITLLIAFILFAVLGSIQLMHESYMMALIFHTIATVFLIAFVFTLTWPILLIIFGIILTFQIITSIITMIYYMKSKWWSSIF